MKSYFYFILLILFNCIPVEVTAQSNVQFAYYVDGYWSSWNRESSIDHMSFQQTSISKYPFNAHPSEYYWRVSFPSYKTRDGEWDVYEGTFEYYITDEFPDLKSIFLHNDEYNKWVNPRYHITSKGQTPCVKRTEKVTVKKYREELTNTVLDKEYFLGKKKYKTYTYGYKYTYNIFFNNGLGFAFCYEDHF